MGIPMAMFPFPNVAFLSLTEKRSPTRGGTRTPSDYSNQVAFDSRSQGWGLPLKATISWPPKAPRHRIGWIDRAASLFKTSLWIYSKFKVVRKTRVLVFNGAYYTPYLDLKWKWWKETWMILGSREKTHCNKQLTLNCKVLRLYHDVRLKFASVPQISEGYIYSISSFPHTPYSSQIWGC